MKLSMLWSVDKLSADTLLPIGDAVATVRQARIINGRAATHCTGEFAIATALQHLWRCVTTGR